MKKILFSLIVFVLVSGFITVLVLLALPSLEARYQPLIVQQLTAQLPEAEKKRLYDLIAKETPALWDTVPDPRVGRIAKPNMTVMQSYAEVKTNNAGMRASTPYRPKAEGMYRIVCLGDSFVFGEAGKEEDRFCDQIGEWFANNDVLMDGKPVETLALGLPSWTMQQEAAYLISRLSDYAPDLIIVLTVKNDITADSGVTGAGLITNDFSNSEREWGSGNFGNMMGGGFGFSGYTALYSDVSLQSQRYWQEGMQLFSRLASLQQAREGKILFSVLNIAGKGVAPFENSYREQFVKAGLQQPFITVSYERSPETILPHDGHPNKEGHGLLRDQYLMAMQQLGWLPDDAPVSMKGGTDALVLNPAASVGLLEEQRVAYANSLPEAIDFRQFKREQARAFLGGVLPGNDTDGGLPWLSIRSGFLLQSPKNNERQLQLVIDIPDRVELFPLALNVDMHGLAGQEYHFESAGEHTIVMDIPEPASGLLAIEIVITANHYFSQIDDHRMKVVQLKRIGWQ